MFETYLKKLDLHTGILLIPFILNYWWRVLDAR